MLACSKSNYFPIRKSNKNSQLKSKAKMLPIMKPRIKEGDTIIIDLNKV